MGEPDNATPLSPSLSPTAGVWRCTDPRQWQHRRLDPRNRTRGLQPVHVQPVERDHPSWSPNGDRIFFNSNRNGSYELYEKSTTGSADETLVVPMVQSHRLVHRRARGALPSGAIPRPTGTSGFCRMEDTTNRIR